MTRTICQEQAREQVRRVQRGVRRLVDGLMNQLQTVEALAGAPEEERLRLGEEMRQTRSRLLEEYWAVERQSAELGHLYAASCRLHASVDPHQVLTAIRAVATELTGCQRLALYEVDEATGSLKLAADFDDSGRLPSRVSAGVGALGRAVSAGRPWVASNGPPDELGGVPVAAAAPLMSAGQVTAVLVLLDQPAPAVELSHAFELLGTHGGAALNAARMTSRPRALQAV